MNYPVPKFHDFNENAKKFVMITFRGTDSTRNWRSNAHFNARYTDGATALTGTKLNNAGRRVKNAAITAKNWIKSWFSSSPPSPKQKLLGSDGNYGLHAGFLNIWEKIAPTVTDWVDEHAPPGVKVVLTGHSLGGALSEIAGLKLVEAGKLTPRNLKIITFEAPKIGKSSMVDEWRRRGLTDSLLQIVNKGDLVPTIPPFMEHPPAEHIMRVNSGDDRATEQSFWKADPHKMKHVQRGVLQYWKSRFNHQPRCEKYRAWLDFTGSLENIHYRPDARPALDAAHFGEYHAAHNDLQSSTPLPYEGRKKNQRPDRTYPGTPTGFEPLGHGGPAFPPLRDNTEEPKGITDEPPSGLLKPKATRPTMSKASASLSSGRKHHRRRKRRKSSSSSRRNGKKHRKSSSSSRRNGKKHRKSSSSSRRNGKKHRKSSSSSRRNGKKHRKSSSSSRRNGKKHRKSSSSSNSSSRHRGKKHRKSSSSSNSSSRHGKHRKSSSSSRRNDKKHRKSSSSSRRNGKKHRKSSSSSRHGKHRKSSSGKKRRSSSRHGSRKRRKKRDEKTRGSYHIK